jgi:hypothetical protein
MSTMKRNGDLEQARVDRAYARGAKTSLGSSRKYSSSGTMERRTLEILTTRANELRNTK